MIDTQAGLTFASAPRRDRREAGVFLIPLSKGYYAVIEDADAPLVLPFKWTAQVTDDGNVYAYRWDRSGDRPRHLYLHRAIAGSPVGVLIDHKDGDGLNCRRTNLRETGHSGNGANRRYRGNRSRFKGVQPTKNGRKWKAYIGGPTRYLGTFDHDYEAAIAYDQAAIERHARFARTNFPIEVA